MSNWAPHLYREEGERNGCDPQLLDALVKEGSRLAELGIPVVFTLNHLATICGVRFGFLHQVVAREIDPYRIFNLRKRSGGYRQITVPASQLLAVQRWIHQNILLSQSAHPISAAYGAGCTPLSNAQRHIGAKCLVKIDLERFFESISERQVYHAFVGIGYPPLLAFEFTRICTRASERARHYRSRRWKSMDKWDISDYSHQFVGHLPQGAPTSPILANLACSRLDQILHEIAVHGGYIVSRYADDIVFSSRTFNRNSAVALIAEVDTHLRQFGFRRNATKTHIVSPGARKLVTGLLIDRDKPALTKVFRDRLRSHLYYAKEHGPAEHCRRRKFKSLLGFRNFLRGLISYSVQVDPAFGAKCQEKFDEIPWGLLSDI